MKDLMASYLVVIAGSLIGCVFGVLVLVECFKHWRDVRLKRDSYALEILLPYDTNDGAMQFWTQAHDFLSPSHKRLLHGQPYFSFEFVWLGEQLRFRIWATSHIPPTTLNRMLTSAWPGSSTQPWVEPPGTLSVPSAHQAGGSFALGKAARLPLKAQHREDPLTGLLGAMAGLGANEAAVVQVVAKPETSRTMRSLTSDRNSYSSRILDFVFDLAGLKIATNTGRRGSQAKDVRGPKEDAEIRTKIFGLGFRCNVRYVVVSDEGQTSKLKTRANELATTFAAFSGLNNLRRIKLRGAMAAISARSVDSRLILSVSELAALAHLPFGDNITGVQRASARRVVPDLRIARKGKVVGIADAGAARPIAISAKDATQHLHVMGATGSGKSTLLTNLVLDDISAKQGVIVIDPKGDLITDVLERLSPEETERVVLFDPGNPDLAPSLDVLSGSNADLVVDNIVGIFSKVFEANWGPRTEDVLRSACSSLVAAEQRDLSLVPKLLSDANFRQEILGVAKLSTDLQNFWDWYDLLSDGQQALVIGPVLGKLRAFFTRDFVRSTIRPGRRALDLSTELQSGIVLVRIPKGELGSETVKLIGSLIVARVWQASLSNISKQVGERPFTTLYMDECQNFLNLPGSIDEMLAEARGYGLGLVLAHQHLGQLPKDMRSAFSANARNKAFFSMSPEDAKSVERHFLPSITRNDLEHLSEYQLAARLISTGREIPACTATSRMSSIRSQTYVEASSRIRNQLFPARRPDTESRVEVHERLR